MRETLAVDGARRIAGGKTRKFRIFGVVFTFANNNRDNALEEIVGARAKEVDGVFSIWEKDGAREVTQVQSSEARDIGFYTVQTMLDENEYQRTDVRYRR